jgi:drug/metabolite transporter (DMT)-like permease
MKQNSINHRINPGIGQGAIFLCAVLWSTSGLFIKLIDWHPILIAGIRSFIAAVFLCIIGLLFPRRGNKNKPFLVIITGIAYAGTMISFVTANKLTTSANAILLQYSAPIWAALLGWVLIKEALCWEHWGALILIIPGLFIFFKDSLGGGALVGDGLALFSGILFGTHSVLLRMQKDANPTDSMLMAHSICAGVALPFLFIYPPSLTVLSISAILYMGTLQIGCASLLFAYGIKRVSAVQAMLTAMIEPVLNPLWVFIVTKEKPSFSAIFGGSLIIIAVVFSSLIGKHREMRTNNNA